MDRKKNFFLPLISLCLLGVVSCGKTNQVPTVTNPAPAPLHIPVVPHTFVIYSQIRYNNTPTDLSQYGISQSILHGPTSFLNPLANDPDMTGNVNLDNKIIDAGKLTALAQSDLNIKANVPIILDIESWSFATAKLSATIDSFSKAITIYKINNANSPLGFYGSFPQTKYQWSNIQDPLAYQTWQSINNQLAPIVKLIQFFAPSLYTRDDVVDSLNWKSFALANLREAKRYNTNIPVYAYIEPQYVKDAMFLPAKYWQYQLEELYNMGYDGVIIWTSNKDSIGKVITFSVATQQDWWATTLNFIKEKNIKAQ